MSSSRVYNDIAEGEKQHKEELPELSIRAADTVADLDDCLYIYRTTADLTIQAEPQGLEIGSYIWMRPYLDLSSIHCLILAESARSTNTPTEDGRQWPSPMLNYSRAVGYLLLALSTRQFYRQLSDEYVPSLPESLRDRPCADVDTNWRPGNLDNAIWKILHSPQTEIASIETKYPGLLDSCPAHLHIDILPKYQGRGWGKTLMDAALEHLRRQNVGGVHLIMAEGNLRARKFYEEKCGFYRWRDHGEGEWVMWQMLK